MDWGSLAGLVIAIAGLVFGQTIESGHLKSLMQPAAFVVVMLETTGAMLLQTELKLFIKGLRMLRWVFVHPEDDRKNWRKELTSGASSHAKKAFYRCNALSASPDNPDSNIRNSSPPMHARKCDAATFCRRSATCCSKWLPTACPCASLIHLK